LSISLSVHEYFSQNVKILSLEYPCKVKLVKLFAIELLIASKKRFKNMQSTVQQICSFVSLHQLFICSSIVFYGASFDQHSTRQAVLVDTHVGGCDCQVCSHAQSAPAPDTHTYVNVHQQAIGDER
jgi:hypothetical protein